MLDNKTKQIEADRNEHENTGDDDGSCKYSKLSDVERARGRREDGEKYPDQAEGDVNDAKKYLKKEYIRRCSQ